jgi:UDP-N-acetylmuramoyl-L-alanyl-D-glutamate--2,6-diaminopimelate ligase
MVLGLDLPTVARGLESVECLPGRLERIECGQPFSVFVDCADSAERLTVALKTVRRVTQGRLLCLVSSDSEERRDERPLVGRVVEKFADLAVLTGGPSRHGDPSGSIHDILDGYDRPARAHVIPTRKKAIPWLLDQARPGDSLLIAGSARTADLGGYAVCSDSELARHWLYDAGRREVELSSKRARSRQKG